MPAGVASLSRCVTTAAGVAGRRESAGERSWGQGWNLLYHRVHIKSPSCI